MKQASTDSGHVKKARRIIRNEEEDEEDEEDEEFLSEEDREESDTPFLPQSIQQQNSLDFNDLVK